ncbi:MAG TPA: cytidylate kinase-like family protein [Bacillota bacterium]|nr:cytidylate kinase-like family protein [Bacillota bacterium]HPT68039.1 cytidylate kinase-like family protein [Bacillota bacterium]
MGNYIITIAREYGSGGRVIGQQVAEELGIAFYDKKLITLAAKESGFAEDIIERVEQKKELSFFYNLYLTGQEMSLSEQVFLAECNVIRKIAEEHSCVILGRCADYVLQEQKNCLRVFIHAPLALRAKWVREQYKVNRPDLEDYIRKQDKNRAAYYNYFTHNKWGESRNYHLCLDSSIGIAACVRILKDLVEEFIGGVASGNGERD